MSWRQRFLRVSVDAWRFQIIALPSKKVSLFQPQQHKVEGSGNESYHQLVPVNDPLTSGGCRKLRVTNSVKLQILQPVLVPTCGGFLVSPCREMRKEESWQTAKKNPKNPTCRQCQTKTNTHLQHLTVHTVLYMFIFQVQLFNKRRLHFIPSLYLIIF